MARTTTVVPPCGFPVQQTPHDNGCTVVNETHRRCVRWAGRTILDPDHGKVYGAKMALLENDKNLNVRDLLDTNWPSRIQT